MPSRPGAVAPYTNLLQQCGVGGVGGANCQRTGQATSCVDREIGRVVVQLAGPTPGASSLRLPRRREDSLGATGRYLYLQLRLAPGKPYAVHAELATADRGVHRLSVSNLGCGREGARAGRTGVQVHLPATHDGWTLLALDLAALARQACPRSRYHHLRALTLGATLTLRSAFTSDAAYSWDSLPDDLRFTAAYDAAAASVLWVPQEPELGEAPPPPPRRRPASPGPPPPPAAAQIAPAAALPAPAGGGQQQPRPQHMELCPRPVAQPRWVSAFSGAHPGLLLWVPPPQASQDGSGEVLYAAGSLLVAMQPDGGRQRFLRGHARPVRALALSGDGGRLASAEEGPGAALRLWDVLQGRCLALVPGHEGGTTCLDLSPDGSLLASAGVDGQGRQELALWDVAACWAAAPAPAAAGPGGGPAAAKPVQLARQVSDYNMQSLRFVPWGEPGRLVTCGKNSVRLHRLRNGALRGLSVLFDGVAAPPRRRPGSCGTLAGSCSGEVFTRLGFEARLAAPAQPRRLYVGALSGAVYTIDLGGEARAVEGVAPLHDAPLTALAVRAGVGLATGCADGLLRLWGPDLARPQLEAQHEGAVTGIAQCPGGQRLVVGTHSGALSLLDPPAQRYTTLLRSHTAAVHAVALLGQPPLPGGGISEGPLQYCTAGADGTVRVWDAAGHQQALELTAPGEAVLSLACHPHKLEVACGFHGGAMRVFEAGSAQLVHESRQHSGAVTQLVYARHGRLLLSLGGDGCVCTYDAQRAHLPGAYLLAGFPLHATCMAATEGGPLLAVAALSLAPGGSPAAAWGAATVGTAAHPVVVLFSALTLQPSRQLSVAGASPVAHLQLLPDAGLLLAATADGRLRGYRCADGGLVLDVPRCLPRPCLATALNPAATLLMAGGSCGHLVALGLHALRAASVEPGAGAEPLGCLPSQELASPAAADIQGAAFLPGGRQLLTVGAGGEVCSWDVHADTWASSAPACDVVEASAATPVPQWAAEQPAAGQEGPVPEQAAVGAEDVGQASSPIPTAAFAPELDAATLESPPAPRPLPAVLQQGLRPRPPSAPPVVPQQGGPAPLASRQLSASLPSTPLSGGSKRASPAWDRERPPKEASLQVTCAGGVRSAQVVRAERRLVVTSPRKQPGGKEAQRSAAWVDAELPGNRVPALRPQQQLRLLPPAATVQRLHGFDAAAGFCWLPSNAGGAAAAAGTPERQLAYAAGNVLVVEGLAAGQQRHLARLPRDVCALAACPATSLAAVAVAPAGEPVDGGSGAGGGAGELHLLDLATGEALALLSHHSYAATCLAFGPPSTQLLASLSSHPQHGASLALWSAEQRAGGAELVAAAALPEPVAALTWCGNSEQPAFYTAGPTGLALWQLGAEALHSTAVHLPARLRGVPLTAAAWVEDEAWSGGAGASRWRPAARGSRVVVGDASGRCWLLDVDEGQDVRRWQLVAELGGQALTCLQATGALVAAGTASGLLLLLAVEGGQSQGGEWRTLCCEQLDGPVLHIQLEGAAQAASAATATGTLWQVVPGGTPQVLLCGQQHAARGWQLTQGAAWKGDHPVAAVASAAGVAVWQLDGVARAPLVEFPGPADATHAALADDGSCAAAAYADGDICLWDAAQARLRWRVAGAAAQGGVVALALVQRLRGLKVMVAYRSGALYVLDGGSGQVAHRCMQFATRQDSGRACPSNFPAAGLALCPADTAVFALCGASGLAVCRAHWLKNAAVHVLARLSFGPAGSSAAGVQEPPAGGPVAQAAFSRVHAGHLYCTDPCHPGQLLLLDFESQAVVKTLQAPLAAGAHITALALHPRETLLAASTSTGGMLLLRLDTEAWAELAAHGEGAPVVGLAFSACGRRLFSAAGSATFEWGVAD